VAEYGVLLYIGEAALPTQAKAEAARHARKCAQRERYAAQVPARQCARAARCSATQKRSGACAGVRQRSVKGSMPMFAMFTAGGERE